MFGMGIGELAIIAVVALLCLGPDRLPEAARALSKGIRDLRKHSRDLQDSLDSDGEIGGAVRDLRNALQGHDPYVPPRVRTPRAEDVASATAASMIGHGEAAAPPVSESGTKSVAALASVEPPQLVQAAGSVSVDDSPGESTETETEAEVEAEAETESDDDQAGTQHA